MAEPTERCVGCGAFVPRIDGPVHAYMTSAPGCWAMYGELNAYYFSSREAVSYRQLCVDAYAVQHPGTPGPQAIQSVAVHLISLYDQLELESSAEQAPALIHRAVARLKGRLHWLTPPSFAEGHTIAFMLANRGNPSWASREWATSAWRAWAAHHDQVRAWHQAVTRLA